MAGGFDPDAYLKAKQGAQPSGDFDPDAYLQAKTAPEKGTLQKIGETVDAYTGAPTRTAVSQFIKDPKNLGGAIDAFTGSFGKDSTKAPKGRDIAVQIGINDNPAEMQKAFSTPSLKGLIGSTLLQAAAGPLSELIKQPLAKKMDEAGTTNADIAGLPIELAADWTNLIGLGAAKGAGNAAKFMQKGGKLVRVVDEAANIAKAAPKIIENGAELVNQGTKMAGKLGDGFNATDAIRLANEGGNKVNAEVVKSAAQRLGFEPSRGMLTNNPTIRGLESSLEQSPSIAGSMVRSDTDKVRKGVTKAVESLAKDTNSYSKFEVGERVKAGILEKIAQRHAPIAEQFNKLRESTQFIEVPEKSRLTIAKNFLKHPDVALMPGSKLEGIATEYGRFLQNVKSVDDVKRLRTIAGKAAKATLDPNEQNLLNHIYGSLTRLEESTIKRAAIAQARTSGEGAKVGRQMIGELREAKKGYSTLMTDVKEVGQVSGLKKPRSIEHFLDLVDNVPSEQLGDRLFKTNDLRALNTIEKQFPGEFSLLRQQKVSEIVEKSMVKGQLDAGKFIKTVKGMGPEVVSKIFGGDASRVLEDVNVVLNALPNKIGPSGTPQGEMFMNLLKPIFQVQEGARFGAYKKLQNPTIPMGALKNTIPFKKAGQAPVQTLSDLLGVTNKAKQGVNSTRAVEDTVNRKK